MSTGSQYGTIDNNLLSKMSRQLKMKNVAEFRQYIECIYSEDNYLDFLKKEGYI
jgi:hypothetical protein